MDHFVKSDQDRFDGMLYLGELVWPFLVWPCATVWYVLRRRYRFTGSEAGQLVVVALIAALAQLGLIWAMLGEHWWYQTIAEVPHPWLAALYAVVYVFMSVVRLFYNDD